MTMKRSLMNPLRGGKWNCATMGRKRTRTWVKRAKRYVALPTAKRAEYLSNFKHPSVLIRFVKMIG